MSYVSAIDTFFLALVYRFQRLLDYIFDMLALNACSSNGLQDRLSPFKTQKRCLLSK